MVFNSLSFALFFAVVLAIHHLPIPWRARKLNLLGASYLFYMAWNPPFVLLLWISTLVDWVAARRIAGHSRKGRRRAWLALSLAVNLGLLAFFKYSDFLVSNTMALLAGFGIDYAPAAPDIILPLGISFYTFQTLSYSLDVYRGQERPAGSFLDYALYVTFFPQLVAGPIVRSGVFLPQCESPRRADSQQWTVGLSLLSVGLFQKIVLADDLLAPSAEALFDGIGPPDAISAWIGTLAFSGQIFCDFAGYSSCALGAASCLGFRIPANFRSPYAAVGFSDFWRRWHVSLSSWLRDYLYISLGGNRAGIARTYANLMITMLVGGLWHGASWTFVAWGGLHGAYLTAERWLRGRVGGLSQRWVVQLPVGLFTFAVVTVTWVFFRAPDFTRAFQVLAALFGRTAEQATRQLPPNALDPLAVLAVVVSLVTVHWLQRDTPLFERFAVPWWIESVGIAAIWLAIVMTPGTARAFIYFQF